MANQENGTSVLKSKRFVVRKSLIGKNQVIEVTFKNGIDSQETLFSELDIRLRNIQASPGGIIYLLTDGPNGKLIKVLPKEL